MSNWWMNAKGQKMNSHEEFVDYVEAHNDKFIVVDFYMPQCHFCVEFMNDWNKVVSEFQEKYGDQVLFVKVDGIESRATSNFYGVTSFPSFFMLEPGSNGTQFNRWRPSSRSYAAMKKWILDQTGGKLVSKDAMPAVGTPAAHGALPTPALASADMQQLLSAQQEESKRLSDALDVVLAKQREATEQSENMALNMDLMMTSQQDLQAQLTPVLDGSNQTVNPLSAFLGGLLIGAIAGMVFVTYLVKQGRLGQKKKNERSPLPAKEFVGIAKRPHADEQSARTGSTRSGSDESGDAETDRLL